MYLKIKNILFITFSFISFYTINAQLTLPQTPICTIKNNATSTSVDSLLFLSEKNLIKDPLTSFCYLNKITSFSALN